ncbi:aspartate aminotransferase family protein [Bryobacter aggregatus]|uniref:aspartate aminotransferase family protein n=1 Tax=Bryobacter aggregatus TaxID=360054 RepID=UPI00068D0F2E|nr:aspartate aminotransferase family protein [Bryobacter aggregatus]
MSSSIETAVRAKTMGSAARYARAQKSLAGGVSSGLRRNARPYPLYFSHGEGSQVWDVDGNRYTDFGLAWGPLILGHAPPKVVAAVQRQAARGMTFGAQHDLEFEVAERLTQIIPCAGLVTFANSGTEIVQVALRLARAITGKQKYLKFEGHYHGWSDEVLTSYKPTLDQLTASQGAPIPVGLGQLPNTNAVIAEWNNRESVLAALDDNISAVLCEPLLANSGCIPPAPGFLEFLRAECTRRQILLIFDEVVTGFRLALGGAQAHYGVTPDLATFAKALGAGTPLSVLAGHKEYMDWIARGEVVHAGTLNGNPLALAAANAALDELSQPDVYPRLHTLAAQLRNGIEEAFRDAKISAHTTGTGPVFQLHVLGKTVSNYRDTLQHDRQRYSDFALALLHEGILILPDGRWYLSAAHTALDIAETVKKVRYAIVTTSC